MANIQKYSTENFQEGLYINLETGEVFATVRSLARLLGKNQKTIQRFLSSKGFDSDDNLVKKTAETKPSDLRQSLKSIEIETDAGKRIAKLIPEHIILEAISKYKPDLAEAFYGFKNNKILEHNSQNTSSLQKFNFNDFQVRTFYKENQIWFAAVDVCRILEIANTGQAVENLDEDEKGVSNTYTLGGNQDLTIINESGLYSLVLRSRKPQAKEFKKWITSEVLPSIRKTGKYELGLKSDKELLLESQLMAKDLEFQLSQAKLETLEAKKLMVEKENYILRAINDRPGLERMLEDFQQFNPNVNLLPGTTYKVSLREWMLGHKKIILEGSLFNKFVSKVHGAYKALNHKAPEKEWRQLAKDKSKTLVQVYEIKDYSILDQCYYQTILEQ